MLLLLQCPLICCCCSVSLITFSIVKQQPGPVLPTCGTTDYCKTNSMRMCNLHVQSTRGYKNRVLRVQYMHTILMTEFESCTMYTVPRLHIKSEVHFGLKLKKQFSCISKPLTCYFQCTTLLEKKTAYVLKHGSWSLIGP